MNRLLQITTIAVTLLALILPFAHHFRVQYGQVDASVFPASLIGMC